MESIKKFSDLTSDTTYVVHGYDGPINSKFGINYVLLVNEINTDDSFQMWSSNLLAEYITEKNPTDKFKFVVKEKNNTKYPAIEGYIRERKFKILS